MNPRKLPSLSALRAFEASARHQSFTLASHELCVTQGAISHQVKALEEELGLKLFERLHNQLRLTDIGHRYLEVIRNAFDHIERGTKSLYRQQGKHALVISTSPNFASKWLVPRLGSFSAKRPMLDLRLELTQHHVNFLDEDVSLAIRYGEGPWPGLNCTRLGAEFLVPVCSPQLGNITAASEITQHVLLHSHDHRSWGEWFETNEWPRELAERGIVFNQESAAVDAAVSGQGIALARATLVVHDLIQKRLLMAIPRAMPIHQSYWLVYPKIDHIAADFIAFRDWLLEAFEADRQFWQCLFEPLSLPER